MPDKISDNEIIKALESMIKFADMVDRVVLDAVDVQTLKNILDLINRYRVMRDIALKAEAENERLKKEKDEYAYLYDKHINTAFSHIKAEAYKEFAERLYEELRIYGIKDKFNKAVFLNVVDKVKKELDGDDE